MQQNMFTDQGLVVSKLWPCRLARKLEDWAPRAWNHMGEILRVSPSMADYCQRPCHGSCLDLPRKRANQQSQTQVFKEEGYSIFFLDTLRTKSEISSMMRRHCGIKYSNGKNMILGIKMSWDEILTVFITVHVILNKWLNKSFSSVT